MKPTLRFFPFLFAAAGIACAQSQLIGNNSIQTSVDNDSAGQAEAFQATASLTGTVTSMSVYLDGSNSATTVFVGLYSNTGGHPGALLGSAAVASPNAGKWNSVAVSPPVPVTAGAAYFIALLGTGGTLQFRDTDGGSYSETSSQTNLANLPASWSSGSSWASGPVSAFGSGTATGAPQITINPGSATVDEGGTLRFSATLIGGGDQTVHWSVQSGHGVITPTGLFTAPNHQETDVVEAVTRAIPHIAAMATVTVPPVTIAISPTNVTVPPNGTQLFTASVTGTVNTAVRWSTLGEGRIDQNGIYTAPSTPGKAIVTATSAARPSASAQADVSVQPISAGECGNSLNWTNSLCQQIASGSLNTAIVNGVRDPHAWSVISRHGEYAQSETECNVPGAVSVANGVLTIATTAASANCGDFDPVSGDQCSGLGSPCPGTFPYTTGDVQWNTFSFLYGVVIYRAQFPAYPTVTWPAIWMLGTNCQNSNKYTGDTSLDGCPNIGGSGYNEVDNSEFYGGPNGWGRFNIANPNWSVAGPYATAPVDGNYHVFATEWTPTGMQQYLDGTLEASTTETVDVSMFLIIQTQTGGAGGTPDNTQLPAYLNVDYVKVCNANYDVSQCEAAAVTDPNVIFFDNFGGPAK